MLSDFEKTGFIQTGVDVLEKLLPLTEPHLLAGDLGLEAFADGRILEEFQQLVQELRGSMQENQADSSLRLECMYVLAAAYVWTLRWHKRVSLQKSRQLFVNEYTSENANNLENRLFSKLGNSPFEMEMKKFFYLFLTRGSYLERRKSNSEGRINQPLFVSWSDVLSGIATVFERADSMLIEPQAQILLSNAEVVEQEFLAAAAGLKVYREHQQGVGNN